MPPRKRAASAPKTETEQEPLAPETETDGQEAEVSDETAAAPADNDGDQAPDDANEQDDSGDKDDAPERSDLQTADQPCTECMPNGWPEGAYSVGCTHGTYIRKQD